MLSLIKIKNRMKDKYKECQYGLYTCSNLLKDLHSEELCKYCDDGNNYEHKDNFK